MLLNGGCYCSAAAIFTRGEFLDTLELKRQPVLEEVPSFGNRRHHASRADLFLLCHLQPRPADANIGIPHTKAQAGPAREPPTQSTLIDLTARASLNTANQATSWRPCTCGHGFSIFLSRRLPSHRRPPRPIIHISTPNTPNFSPSSLSGSFPNVRHRELTPFSNESFSHRP